MKTTIRSLSVPGLTRPFRQPGMRGDGADRARFMGLFTAGADPTLRSASGYRPEIDGLRAIAVVSVLLYHLDLPLIPAGFVGVDIFFVISGYLITSILMQELAEGRFNLTRFYRRRALRILPPLVLVLAVTLVLAVAVMLPGELRETARAAIASLLFVSNIFFWSSFDYFTPDAKENPLLHTWSLGIEEQFYLIVPLILWGLHRWARPQVKVLFALSVLVSFAVAVWMVGDRPKAAFYLLPARYWEMGAGALLAMGLPLARAGGQQMARWLAEVLGLAGLALIGVGLFVLSPDTAFPGLNALWPVLGAVALIASGGASATGRVLSLAPMVFLGRISYSLYLWHWPLIVLWKLRQGPDLSGAEQAGLGLVAVILAMLTTKLVEAPFRHLPARISDGRVLGGAAAALAVAAGLAFAVQSEPERLRGYPAGVLDLARYDGFHGSPAFIAWNRRHLCFLAQETPGGFAAYDKTACLAPSGDRPVALMLGDSLSAHLWHAVSDAYPDYSVLQANASGCRPFPGQGAYPGCTDLMDFIHDDWIPREKPDLVVLSARWQAGEHGKIVQAVDRLRKAGVGRIIVLGPTVEYKGALSRLLARDLLAGQERAPDLVDPARWDVSADIKVALAGSGAEYVDMLALLCPERRCQTWAPTPPGAMAAPMAFDYGHYTPEGAAHVAALLAPVLRPHPTQDAAP